MNPKTKQQFKNGILEESSASELHHAYDRALRREVEADVLEQSVKKKGNVVTVTLPGEILERMEGLMSRDGWQGRRNHPAYTRHIKIAVALSIDEGLKALEGQH